MTEKIKGQFEVSMNPVDTYAEGLGGNTLARMTMGKTFLGALSSTSKGEMFSGITATNGSAGYLAIEQVSGTLSKKVGGFVLLRFGIMDKGGDKWLLEVVPDSGTEALVGLTGIMHISMEEERHYYAFDFSIVD